MDANSQAQQRPGTHVLITQLFTDKLQAGIVPWHCPWGAAGPPFNPVSRLPYRGINALMLGMAGYAANFFVTYDQVKSLGGKVQRGQKGHILARWDKPADSAAKAKLMHYTVFNTSQCDIPEGAIGTGVAAPTPVGKDNVLKNMPLCPAVSYKEPQPYYDAVSDIIHVPKKKGGTGDGAYHAMLFRQLVHSTGHDSRLARKGFMEMSDRAAAPLYSREDLTAEIGMCLLLSATGLTPELPAGDEYIKGWLDKLSADKWLIIGAATDAGKACDFILNQPRSGQ